VTGAPDRIFDADPGARAEHQSGARAAELYLCSRGKASPNCNTINDAVSVAHEPPLRIKAKPHLVGANTRTSGRTSLLSGGCFQ
jgi:hypothetical protein